MKRRSAIASMMLLVVASACGSPASYDKTGSSVSSSKLKEFRSQGIAGSGQVGAPEPLPLQDQNTDSSVGAGQAARPADVQRTLPDLPPLPSKLIKNANVELEVKKGQFTHAFDRAESIAEQLGGFVGRTSVNRSKGTISSGDVTMRVPSDKFQQAVSQLKRLGKLVSEDQSGEDVTKQFVDLEARLRNAKAQEAFFLKLIDQSKSISDLLQVQQQLSSIQLQIEQIQGELQVLKDQTSFSTISAHIFEPGAAEPRPTKGLGHALRQAVDAFKSVLAGVIVVLGYVIPLGLIGLIIGGALRLAYKRRARRDKVDGPAETS